MVTVNKEHSCISYLIQCLQEMIAFYALLSNETAAHDAALHVVGRFSVLYIRQPVARSHPATSKLEQSVGPMGHDSLYQTHSQLMEDDEEMRPLAASSNEPPDEMKIQMPVPVRNTKSSFDGKLTAGLGRDSLLCRCNQDLYNWHQRRQLMLVLCACFGLGKIITQLCRPIDSAYINPLHRVAPSPSDQDEMDGKSCVVQGNQSMALPILLLGEMPTC